MSPDSSLSTEERASKSRLREVGLLFLKLGVIGFGGPAAHIAMMEDEVVRRRGWLPRGQFLDLVGATNLIPGPNSTEMAIHLGYLRAGWRGLLLAGAAFILPATSISLLLAWLYVRLGQLPEAAPLLAGIKPAVLAIIAGAIWRLGRHAVHGVRLLVLALAVLIGGLLAVNPLLLLLGGGAIGALLLLSAPGTDDSSDSRGIGGGAAALGWLAGSFAASLRALQEAPGISLLSLAGFFLKVGSVLYGSGYLLVAFLEQDLVRGFGWLTEPQLLDAIAVGQFTPGPVLSTAAFVGYLLAGLPGGVVATAAIFAPSFFFVALLSRVLPQLRKSVLAGAFLDAVNACAVALMLAVLIRLGQAALQDLDTVGIALAAALAHLRWQVSALWLVLAGGALGFLLL